MYNNRKSLIQKLIQYSLCLTKSLIDTKCLSVAANKPCKNIYTSFLISSIAIETLNKQNIFSPKKFNSVLVSKNILPS